MPILSFQGLQPLAPLKLVALAVGSWSAPLFPGVTAPGSIEAPRITQWTHSSIGFQGLQPLAPLKQ